MYVDPLEAAERQELSRIIRHIVREELIRAGVIERDPRPLKVRLADEARNRRSKVSKWKARGRDKR